MENKTNPNVFGLKKFGYITDFSAQLAQINHLLQGTGKSLKYHEVDAIVDGLPVTNLNSRGWNNFYGKPISDGYAAYKVIDTKIKTASGENIVGLFFKNHKHRTFEGVTWTTLRGIRTEIDLAKRFRLDNIFFASKESLESFLERIASNAVQEEWGFDNNYKYPILKSYIEYTFCKLRKEAEEGKENKIVHSTDGQHILFNTNLPDTFGNDILILADVRNKPNGEKYYENPRMFTSGIQGRRENGFQDNANPEPATFFEDVNEVIFQSNWKIDDNFDHLFHIIEDNRSRFPKEFQRKSPAQVAGDLSKAIDLAKRMAKRNFKYIAPMYRPQMNRIQLLMPIYLNGSYKQAPDFALVLTPEKGIYVPETILLIKDAYKNARLIAMPDEAWLRPETVFEEEKEEVVAA